MSSANKEDEEFDERLKTSITQHLQSRKTEFKRYFPELKEQEAIFVGNLFLTTLDVSGIPDELLDQFYDLQNGSSARDVFQEMALFQFWCAMCECDPQVLELAFRILLPFFTTYIAAKAGFQLFCMSKQKQKIEGKLKMI